MVESQWSVIVTKSKDFKSLHLDVLQQSTENMKMLVMAPENGATNQRFKLEEKSDGTYLIINKNSKKAIQPAGLQKGDNIVQCDVSSSNDMQKWEMKLLDDDYYIFQNFKTQYVMDISMSKQVFGLYNKVQQWTYHGKDNQRFKLC